MLTAQSEQWDTASPPVCAGVRVCIATCAPRSTWWLRGEGTQGAKGLGQAALAVASAHRLDRREMASTLSALGQGCQPPRDRAPWGSSAGSRALSRWPRAGSWVLRPTRQAQGPARAAGPGHQGQAPPRPFCCPENVSLKDEVTSKGTHNPQAGPTPGAPNRRNQGGMVSHVYMAKRGQRSPEARHTPRGTGVPLASGTPAWRVR